MASTVKGRKFGSAQALHDHLKKRSEIYKREGEEILAQFRAQKGESLRSKYDPMYAKHFAERGRDGFSLREIAAELDCSIDTFYDWEKNHEEFAMAMKLWREYRTAYYERCHRENSDGRMKGNATLIMNFLSRHASEEYADPTKTTIEVGEKTTDSLGALVKSLAASPFSLVTARPVEPVEEEQDADTDA